METKETKTQKNAKFYGVKLKMPIAVKNGCMDYDYRTVAGKPTALAVG